MEVQKENYPSAQIYLRSEIVLVEAGSSLRMDAACFLKRPYMSISNGTLLQLIHSFSILSKDRSKVSSKTIPDIVRSRASSFK